MNSKMKKTLPFLLLILMVLIIIPQTFATDPVAIDDNSQTVTNDVEDIILNETPTDNHQVSESESIVNYDSETNYWRMTMNPTAITYDEDGCNVAVTIETDMSSAGDLVYWVDGSATTYTVYIGDGYTQAKTTTASFTINLAHMGTSNLFDTDGTYEVSLRPSNGASYMGYSFNSITPEFGSVTVTVGSGGSSSKTATTLTISTGTSIEEGTPIAGTLMAGTTPISGAKINYKFEGSSRTTTTDTDGSFEIDTDYATGTYSDFSYAGDDTYEGSSNSKTITVSAASFGSSDYVTTPTPNSISYTKGTSTKVNIAFEYPSDADFYSDSLKKIYVWIDPIDTTFSSSTGILVEGADASSSGYEFDLETIKDSLTTGEHTLYFGPHAPGLSGAEIDGDADYKPLTVTVSGSGSSKTATTLTIDNTGTTVAKGTPITGTLTDVNGDGISGATIKFTSTYGSSGTSVTTDTDGKFSISTSSAIANIESYSGFEYEGDDTYEGSTSDKTFSVVPAPKIVNITVTPTTATYTAGSSSQLTGTLTIYGGSFYSDNVIVWVDDDSSNYVKVQSLSVTTNPTTFTVDLNDLKDTENNIDLSSVLASGSHTLHFSISSKSYYSSSWTIDEAEVTVTAASLAPKLKVIITEDSIEYTPGTDTIVHGTISYPNTIYGLQKLYVWINNDLSTQEQAYDEDGYAVDIVNGEFTVNLREIDFEFKTGKSYNLTFGPQDGANNNILGFYDATVDLDSVTVTIPGTVKTDTNIILDKGVVVEGSTINGKLVDENNKALTGKTISISLKVPSGLTESSEATTGSDGTFKVSNAKVGVYTFTFAEDSTYAKATNKTTVTYSDKKVIVAVTEDSITYKEGEDTILHGTISGVGSYMFYSGDTELYVWVNGDLSTQEIVYDEDGYKVDMSNGAFTANLKLMDFNFEVGKTYTLTFGPKDGVNNAILTNPYYLYSADLDNVTVKVTDKTVTNLAVDQTSGNLNVGDSITGTLTDGDNNPLGSKTIGYTINGESKSVATGSDGKFSITADVDGVYAGFAFEGDATYETSSNSANFVVGTVNPVLTVSSATITVGDKITGTLTYGGSPLADVEVTYTVEGESKSVTTDSEGKFFITTDTVGTYTDFAFTSDDHGACTSDAVITVNKASEPQPEPESTIVNVTITDSSLTVNNGTVSVHISPSDDSIVNGGSVNLTVDGVTYSSNVTNSVATFNLNLTGGNYSALVAYIAIGNYSNATKNLTVIVPVVENNTNTTTNDTNNSNNNTNVTVDIPTCLTLEFEELESGHELRGKLTDINGNLLNGDVNIALSRLSSGASKTYTVTCTNGDFVLPLHLAVGDYSAQATYNGEGNYLPNSTGTVYIALTDKPSNVILEDNDEVTGVYGENNEFNGELTDKNGNALAGYHVALNITRLSSGASKIYYVTTDYNGNYVLPINLAPGYYTVRTTIDDKNYTGASLSSLIIRSNDSDVDNRSETVLNIVNSVIDYTTGGNLSGKLLNTVGYGIAGQHVDVTLANSHGASKTYNLVTDYTGSFNLPINLARGSYTAVCTYDGTVTYAPSKTGTITVSVI